MGKSKGLANLAGVVIKGPTKLSDKERIEAGKKLYEGRIASKFAVDETHPAIHAQLLEVVLDGIMKEFTAQVEPVAVAAPAPPVSN